jgi:hypothetical protein
VSKTKYKTKSIEDCLKILLRNDNELIVLYDDYFTLQLWSYDGDIIIQSTGDNFTLTIRELTEEYERINDNE